MLSIPNKQRFGLACVGGLALFGCCFVGAKHLRQPAPIVFENAASSGASSAAQALSPATPASPTQVVVHVAGAVKNPGVVHLSSNSRVVDAVHAAGGPKSDADLNAINLAAKLVDGSQLLVPAKGATPARNASTKPARAIKGEIDKSGTLSPVTIEPSYLPSDAGAYKADPESTDQTPAATGHSRTWAKKTVGDVDVNTATAEELQSLPGVGASTAQKIIDFREAHGAFKSADDLLGVPGIGPKKLEKMRMYVKL